jgi:hypothetical protein
MEQLDEHLSGAPKYSFPNFIQIGMDFFIYGVILVISIVLYYAFFESFGVLDLPILKQSIFDISIRTIILTLSIELILIFSNYYLQGQLYKLYNQSILKATVIPILFWVSMIFLIVTFIPPVPGALSPFIRISILIMLYSLLSLIIAQSFEHQNRIKYYTSLLIHWLSALAIFHYLP